MLDDSCLPLLHSEQQSWACPHPPCILGGLGRLPDGHGEAPGAFRVAGAAGAVTLRAGARGGGLPGLAQGPRSLVDAFPS